MTASVTGGSEDGRLSVNSTEDRDNPGSSKSGKGRILYCRKCEGHGEKVILKNHSPTCPYILCACKSCEKLNFKRLKSFNKRNKEKLVLAAALNAQRKTNTDTAIAISDDEESRRSSFSSNGKTPSPSSGMENSEDHSSSRPQGLEPRSMSLGSMTVMSYDIWKAKCAAEKKRLEEERKMLGLPEESKSNNPSETLRKYAKDPSSLPNDVMFSRKRTHSTSTNEEIPKISPKDAHEKKGRYILLPTIPAMKIFVKDDDQVVLDRATGCNILASTSTDNSMQPNQPNPIIVSPTTSFMSPALSAGASAITLPTIYTYQSNQPQAALLAPPLIKPVPLVSHTQASVISSMPSADPSALFRSLQQQSLLPVPDSNPFQSLLVSSLASSSLPQTPLTSAADVVQLLAQQQQLAALLRVSAAPPSLTHPHPQPHPQSIAAPAFRSVTLPSTVPSLPPHSQLPVPVSSPSFLLPPSTTADLLQSLLNHSRQQQPIISHGI